MELVTSLPVDWLAATDPLARGPAPLLRPADAEGGANPEILPFELFLQQLETPLPGGEVLPVDGNGLPVPPNAVPTPAGTGPALAAADAAAVEPALADTFEGGAFERFRLTAALRAVLPAPQSVAATAEPGAAAAALPAGDTVSSALDFGPGLDGPQLPSATAAPRSPLGAETQGPAQQSALAGLAAEVDPSAADEVRGRTRPVATSALPSAGSAELAAAVTPNQAPAAAAFAAPLAEASAGSLKTVRRDAAVPPPLLATTVDAAGSLGTDTPTAWQLPAGPSMTTASAGTSAATPAAHGAPVDTRSPNWQEAFAGRVQWLVDHQVGEARIKLNPPELGAVDVKISLVDDKTYVQLTAGSAATRDELAQTLPRLRELLTASGLDVGGAAVHSGHGGRGGYDDPGARGAAPVEALGALTEDSQFLHRPRREAGRIDTFA